MNLRDLDMNLLVFLDVLLEERSVTNAARALDMSQPALSHALGRLRDSFGDQLLVRSGRQMVPTVRAEAMRGPLRDLLSQMEQLIHKSEDVAPEESDTTYRILTNGFAGYAFLPELMRELMASNERASMRVGLINDKNVRDVLGKGEADFALIIGNMLNMPGSLYHRKLYDDPFVCVVRADHPALDEPFTIERYAELPHVLVSPRGDAHGVIDDVFKEHGLERNLHLVVPNFMAVPGVISKTDCIVTVPRSIARMFAGGEEFARFAAPVELPVGTLSVLWHERMHDDPTHRWFRKVIKTAGKAFEATLDELLDE